MSPLAREGRSAAPAARASRDRETTTFALLAGAIALLISPAPASAQFGKRLKAALKQKAEQTTIEKATDAEGAAIDEATSGGKGEAPAAAASLAPLAQSSAPASAASPPPARPVETGAAAATASAAEASRFTIEIDVVNRPSLDGAAFRLQGGLKQANDGKTSTIAWGSDGLGLTGGGGGEVRIENNDANRARYRGKPAQLRILGDGKYLKAYHEEQRLVNVPNAAFERSRGLTLVLDGRGKDNAVYIGRGLEGRNPAVRMRAVRSANGPILVRCS